MRGKIGQPPVTESGALHTRATVSDSPASNPPPASDLSQEPAAPAPASGTELDLTALRQTYSRASLSRQDLDPDPLRQLVGWLEAAIGAGLPEPYALSLATAGADGRPSVRTVLLRGADAAGLSFYTNYGSHKGADLGANPRAEMLFFWPALERQVRVYGEVARLPAAESDAYFHARPRDSQLAAHASTPQSGVVASRAVLEARFAELGTRYPGEVPRPEGWGGYRLSPQEWEFWQGRPNRLHDRWRYRQGGEDGQAEWVTERLMP